MLTVHRIALDPNNAQRTRFAKAAGVARKACDWTMPTRLFAEDRSSRIEAA
jgi:hypothetical protein